MKRLKSVFTADMDHCYYSGSSQVERHHIFGGAYRRKSEKYGYVIPLHPTMHPNGVHYDRGNAYGVTDRSLKAMAQRHYEANIGSRTDFIAEFGKNYL